MLEKIVERQEILENQLVLDQFNSEKNTEIQNTFDTAEANEMQAMLMEPVEDEIKIESSHIYPELDKFTSHINLNKADIKQENDVQLFERNKKKYNRSETESIIARCVSETKSSLGLNKDKTRQKQACEYIDLMKRLKIDSAMSKSNPQIFKLLNMLSKCSGDAEEYNLSEDELSKLKSEALLLQKKAEGSSSKLEVGCLNI